MNLCVLDRYRCASAKGLRVRTARHLGQGAGSEETSGGEASIAQHKADPNVYKRETAMLV